MLPAWHPHFDVWALVFVLGFGYWYADSRLRPVLAPGSPRPSPLQRFQWYTALTAMLLVSSWPLHDIGETALFTVHMVEHMVLALVVPPLLLRGVPSWLADRTLGHPRLAGVLRRLARAPVAFALFNATFIAIHWPDLVGWMLGSELVHLLVHSWLVGVSLLMWMPVFSPTRAIPRLSYPMQMLYLFLQSLLPTVPASFLTFSSVPIYPVYGDAAMIFGLTAVEDQTISGIVMKVGGGLLLWATIAILWFRWAKGEEKWEDLESELRA